MGRPVGQAERGAVSIAFLPSASAEASTGHHLYPSVAASQMYTPYAPPTGSDHPEQPHPAEPSMTFYPPWYGGGTASPSIRVLPTEPVYWGYGPGVYEPKIVGD